VGLIRVALALLVVVDHAGGGLFGGRVLNAREAVVLFYVISGFYMSLVLSTKYTGAGAWKVFYANRYLRLWPTYFVVLIGTALAYGFFVEVAGPDGPRSHLAGWMAQLSALGALERTAVLLANVSLFGLDVLPFFGMDQAGEVFLALYPTDPASNMHLLILNGPAFTLSIELLFYVLAPLYVRSLRRSLVVLVLALGYHQLVAYTSSANLAMVYHLFPATLVYFTLGAIGYRVSADRPDMARLGPYLVCAAIVGLFMATPLFLRNEMLLAFAAALPFVFEWTRRSKLDREIGNLSYLVYIVHMPLLLALKPRVPEGLLPLWVALGALALALLLRRFVEAPVERLRASFTEKRLGHG
jgi:peptidoglycan/LPS O-acetylase OafA/YrhL